MGSTACDDIACFHSFRLTVGLTKAKLKAIKSAEDEMERLSSEY
jgi:hypothetical protein